MPDRYAAADLQRFATQLFVAGGLADERARSLAQVFLEADLLGFSTHGLQRVPSNLGWLAAGDMRRDGEPEVLVDRRAVLSWDAHRLPGPWVVQRAVAECAARVRDTGIVAMTLRRCTHTACLAAYLVPLIEQRLIGLLMVSTPDERFVSPFGAREAVFSNNPLAFCAPTSAAPLLFDVSMAITAGGKIARAAREGRRLPERSLKTAAGQPTDDPAVMAADPPGTVMPIGGLGHGYKGYALTLMTEVLTQALAGHGRTAYLEEEQGSTEGRADSGAEANAVYLQVIDPLAFGGWAGYVREIDHLLAACRNAAPDDPAQPVRVPGEGAWQRRSRALAEGVKLPDGVIRAMTAWAERLGVVPPQALAGEDQKR
jgi:LDH2 family malate/lactate/ureidoglycolate dehydrogenase